MKRTIILSGILVVLFSVIVGGVVWANSEDQGAEIVLPLLLLAAVALFITALTVMAGVFTSLGLTSPEHALGLPEGSVRAILALMLVFLFFVASLFLFGRVSLGRTGLLEGVPQAQYEQLLGRNVVLDSYRDSEFGAPATYTIATRDDVTGPATDMAQNLLTLLGTLVTAVTAFYFGANVAISARQGYPQPPEAGTAAQQDAAVPVAANVEEPLDENARDEHVGDEDVHDEDARDAERT